MDFEFEIIEPLYIPLIKGTSCVFKVKSSLNTLYILHGGEYIPMNKDANGVFTSEKIDISSFYAAIATKDFGDYKTFVQYLSPDII